MFQNPFSFDGRIRRTEYVLTFILHVIILVLMKKLIGASKNDSGAFFFFLAYTPLIWFFLSQRAKRCHDLGANGWYQFIPFCSLWLLFSDSVVGHNRYGPNPKGIGNSRKNDENGDITRHFIT